MSVRLQEVYEVNGAYTDEHERLSAKTSQLVRTVTINPEQVVAVEQLPSMMVESVGDTAQEMCRVVTSRGEYTVLGSRSVIEKKIFGDRRKVLKG